MNSKTNQVQATYQMASDSEEGNRRTHDPFQDSVFDADDSDDVDGNSDATFPVLKFRERNVDRKQNSCDGHRGKEDSPSPSPTVSDPESSFHANHVAAVDFSTGDASEKFGFDARVNGCFNEHDCSSEVQDGVLTADDDFSPSQQNVNHEFLSFSAFSNEARQSTGSSSFESSGDLAVSEIQNDLIDVQCDSRRISDLRPHSSFCSREHVTDVVDCDCSAVQKQNTNGISNELKNDLPKSRCAGKFNISMSQVKDVNEAAGDCVNGSLVVEGGGQSAVDLCRDPCSGVADEGIRSDVNCDGSRCDIEDSDEFYANGFPWSNAALDCSNNSRSNMEENQAIREGQGIDVMDGNVLFENCVDYDEVTQEGYFDDEESSNDEDEEEDKKKKNQDSQHMVGGEKNEECRFRKDVKLEVDECNDKLKCASHMLEAHNKEEECSEDEERNDHTPGHGGRCEKVENAEEKELPGRWNGKDSENIGEDEQTCFEDFRQNRGVTHQTNPELRCSVEERWCVMEGQTCIESEHLERFHRLEGRCKKLTRCLGEYEEKDRQNQTIDGTEVQKETEMRLGVDEEKKNGGVLSYSKETTVQDGIDKEKKIDNERRREELKSSDDRKEEMFSDDEEKGTLQHDDDGEKEMDCDNVWKEEMCNDDEEKEDVQNADTGNEEMPNYLERKEELQSDEGKEVMQSDEGKEVMQSDEGKEETQSDVEGKEEMQSIEGKEEMQSDDEGKEKMQSIEGKEEMQSDEGNKEMQSDDEEKEEMQSIEGKEEMQSDDEGKEEMQSDEEKEEMQSDEEKKEMQSDEEKEEMQSDNERKEEMQNDLERKEEMQNYLDRKEEMQSDEGKEEMQSDEGKEEMQSIEGKEEMQSDDEGKEKMQSIEGKEEMQSDEGNKEMQSDDEEKEEMQSIEGKEEMQSDDEGKEEMQSDEEKEEMQSDEEKKEMQSDEEKEEMQSDNERKEEMQNDLERKEEMQNYLDRKEEMQSDEEKEEMQSDEGKEEIQNYCERKEEIQSDDEGKEDMQSVEGNEEMQSDDEGKEEIQSDGKGNEEIQHVDEKKEEMQSGDKSKEEMYSDDERRENIQSGHESNEEVQSDYIGNEEKSSCNSGKEEMQSDNERQEEMQSDNERQEEIQNGNERKEEIQSGNEGKEEIQSGNEREEEIQSGNEGKEEIQSGNEREEEIQSDSEREEEIQSGDGSIKEIQSGNERNEEIQSIDGGNEEIQSDDDREEDMRNHDEEKEGMHRHDQSNKEMQSFDERKEEMQSVGSKEMQEEMKRQKAKRPTFLSSPQSNNFHLNFHPFVLSRTEAEDKDEKPLQHETKETEAQHDDVYVRGGEPNDVAIEKKLFGDSIENELTSSERVTHLQTYRKDKNEVGFLNRPFGLCASERKNCFVLNLESPNTAAQTGRSNSRSDRFVLDIPATKKKISHSPCRETTSRFNIIDLDYISSNDATQNADDVFCDEGLSENCHSHNPWKSRHKELSEKDVSKMREAGSKSLSLSAPRGPTNERVEFNDIPEKFLVPPVCAVVQSNIMTPQEDLGFAKVPGYIPRLDSMEEENEVVADSTPDDLQPTAEQEIVADKQAASLPEIDDLESDCSQMEEESSEERHEVKVETGRAQSGAHPKERPSSLQLPFPSSAPLQLSPKLPLSPKPQSKSARPNSLIGLSKPDVNLPSLKPAPHPDAATDEDNSGLIRAKRPDISLLPRKRFTFPTSRNPASSTLTETSLLASPPTLNPAETSTNPQSTISPFPSSSEVPPASEAARVTSASRLVAQRPTSWSQPTLKTKSVLPKRPNSLNITVSNVVPVRAACTDGLLPETTKLGLQVPQSTPCLAGSMVVAQPPSAVLPPSEETLTVPSVLEKKKSLRTAFPDSSSHDPSASVSALPPPICSNINLRITDLGKVAPVWVPDGDAPRCMQCESRFTFTRRRHHCRTCGKVFCSGCCNIKVKLGYLDQKEGRVCSRCYQDLLCAQLYENLSASSSAAAAASSASSLCTVNNLLPSVEPTRWSSTSASSVPSAAPRGSSSGNVLRKEKAVEQSPVSVLDRCYHGNSCLQEAEGGKDGAHTASAAASAVSEKLSAGNSKDNRLKSSSLSLLSRPTTVVPQVTVTPDARQVTPLARRSPRTPLWPDCNGFNINVAVMTEASVPSKFTLLPNLKVNVSIVNLDCCMGRVCWCFVTSGLCAVGQDEVVIVLERLPNEERIPTDVFYHICDLYHEAAKGNPVGYLGHTLVSDGQVLLESADHAGFLYLRPTFQCLQKLPLPPAPYIFGILVHRMEIPWLHVFPVRLMLRLGAQYRYYPCPLVSMRFREPVYREVGHTIMNLLVDLRNFQYRLPRVDGLVVHMEDKKTFINLPRSRYREIKRAFNNNNDHIVALEVSFSCVADSHLVCFQNPEGKYITQAINIQNRPRKITGASFVVFNGALRPISGMHAKCSMVEDGLMVQVSPESMLQLKHSISSAEDYSIGCGRLSGPEPEEWVILKWVDEEKDIKTRPSFNRIRSPIDGLVLDCVRSRRISASTDYVSESLAIRWTEVFYLENPAESRQENDEEFEEVVAQACCMALCHHLEDLQLPALTRIGLRVTLGSEQFGYKIGANCGRLPDVCLRDLDSKLIPVLENPEGRYKGISSTLELFFYLLEQQQQPQPQHLSPEP